jgi:hypothetical protein
MFHINQHIPLCVLKSIQSILMETSAFRQPNTRIVQRAGSAFKQKKTTAYAFSIHPGDRMSWLV